MIRCVLQRKRDRVGIQPLQDIQKVGQAFAVVGLMGEQLAAEGFPAVEGNPGELAAVVIQKTRSQADAPAGDPHMSEYTSDYYKTREFITGFTGSAGTAVVTRDDAGLWTDSRYFLQAADQLTGSGITLYKQGLPDTIIIRDYLMQKLPAGSTICVDGRLVSSAWADILREDTAASSFILRTDADPVGEIWADRPAAEFNAVCEYPVPYAGVPRAEKIALNNLGWRRYSHSGNKNI